MWNPFRKYELNTNKIMSIDESEINTSDLLLKGTEEAQLRSLKARFEIMAIYEGLAEKSLLSMKGR